MQTRGETEKRSAAGGRWLAGVAGGVALALFPLAWSPAAAGPVNDLVPVAAVVDTAYQAAVAPVVNPLFPAACAVVYSTAPTVYPTCHEVTNSLILSLNNIPGLLAPL
jgi:hypothetical protein